MFAASGHSDSSESLEFPDEESYLEQLNETFPKHLIKLGAKEQPGEMSFVKDRDYFSLYI